MFYVTNNYHPQATNTGDPLREYPYLLHKLSSSKDPCFYFIFKLTPSYGKRLPEIVYYKTSESDHVQIPTLTVTKCVTMGGDLTFLN